MKQETASISDKLPCQTKQIKFTQDYIIVRMCVKRYDLEVHHIGWLFSFQLASQTTFSTVVHQPFAAGSDTSLPHRSEVSPRTTRSPGRSWTGLACPWSPR